MSKLFVDTSGWANLFIPTETYHQAASQCFQEAYRQNQTIVTTNYVIAELVSLLNVRLKASRSQQFIYIDTIKTSEKDITFTSSITSMAMYSKLPPSLML